MNYYKDNSKINHRSKLKENLHELAEIVCKEHCDEYLLPLPRKEYEHTPLHSQCSLAPTKNREQPITEKRICRCWNYFNKSVHSDKCKNCDFGFKRVNGGKITIIDYEVPTKYAMDNLGGIDWILLHKRIAFATEVKPPNSQETLARMIAEILTYTIGFEKEYTPAICFFKTQMDGITLSKQAEDYLKYKDSGDFKTIVKKTGLRVFYVTFDENFFGIHDVKEEPII